MDILFTISIVLGICVVLAFGLLWASRIERSKLESSNKHYKELYDKLLSQKKSSEVRLGQIAEHLAPFLKEFHHDPKQAHFLGNPIDYVVFADEGIYFVEIKTGQSKASKKQKDIEELVKNGKVYWELIRLS